MLQLFTFTESSPATATTVASALTVPGSTATAGIAAGQLDDYSALLFIATLQGGTGGTLDVFVQQSPDQGATWFDFAHFAQLAAGAASVTTAFSVSSANQTTTPTVIGSGLTPLLAANTVIAGAWGDRFRLVFKTGVGTSAGAQQVVRILGQRQHPWRA